MTYQKNEIFSLFSISLQQIYKHRFLYMNFVCGDIIKFTIQVIVL